MSEEEQALERIQKTVLLEEQELSEKPQKKKRVPSEKQLEALRLAREKRLQKAKQPKKQTKKKDKNPPPEPDLAPEPEPDLAPAPAPAPAPEPAPAPAPAPQPINHEEEIARLRKELEEARKSNMSGKPAKKQRAKKVKEPQKKYPKKPTIKNVIYEETDDEDDDGEEYERVIIKRRKKPKAEVPPIDYKSRISARNVIESNPVGSDFMSKLGEYGFSM